MSLENFSLTKKSEICKSQNVITPLSGIEECVIVMLNTRNCPRWGPPDLQVMQACREATLNCSRN